MTVTPPVKKSTNPIVPLRRFCLDQDYSIADAPMHRRDMAEWMPDWLLKPQIPLDLAVVVSFGYFIPPSVLCKFKFGGINVHPSLLPKYRGSAPIENTILNGEKETGVSIIGLHPSRFDAGNILNQTKLTIPNQIKYWGLHDLLAQKSSHLLFDTLKDFEKFKESSVSQDEKLVTKAPKTKKEMAIINWNKSTAQEIDRIYRAISHRYGIESFFRNKRFILLDISVQSPSKSYDKLPGSIVIEDKNMFVKCSDGWIQVHKLKMINKNPTDVVGFLNGHLDTKNSSSWIFTQSKL